MAAGCAGPLACGGALVVVPADGVAPWDSSARSMVYERNGGSSEEEEDGAAPWDAGAGLDGPLSSSGTNNTIRTTRMIAPVSRSFTRLSNMGAEPFHSTSLARTAQRRRQRNRSELAGDQYIPSHCNTGPTV